MTAQYSNSSNGIVTQQHLYSMGPTPTSRFTQNNLHSGIAFPVAQHQNAYSYASDVGLATTNSASRGDAKIKFDINKPQRASTTAVIDPTKKQEPGVQTKTETVSKQPHNEQNSQKAGWPKSLRGYVERSFLVANRDGTQTLVEKALKELIDRAVQEKSLWTTDWDTLAVPDVKGNKKIENVAAQNSMSGLKSKGERAATEENGVKSKPTKKAKKDKKLGASHQKNLSNDVMDEEEAKRAERAGRFGDGHAVGGIQHTKAIKPSGKSLQKVKPNTKRKRVQMYESSSNSNQNSIFDSASAPAVKGTCTIIEKSYFRLTSAPPASSVRPLSVLKKALARLHNLVLERGSVADVPYLYLCDQLKAIRQDVTVQHLHQSNIQFCIEVYESHARYAIEALDFAEFNQCQTKLFQYYHSEKVGVGGARTDKGQGNKSEFLAYRILYSSCVLDRSGELERLRCLKEVILLQKDGKEQIDQRVGLSVTVSSAIAENNYVKFFSLYRKMRIACNNNKNVAMSKFMKLATLLMEDAVERQRFRGLSVVVTSYRPTMPIRAVATQMGFRSRDVYAKEGTENGNAEDDDEDEFECQDWLSAHGAVLTDRDFGNKSSAVGGATGTRYASIETKLSMGKIFIPEKEEAVAHGDANLKANNFFNKNFSTL